MSDIKNNVIAVKNEISKAGRNVELVAVTKNFSAENINEAISAGVTHIGENRVQELLSKYDSIVDRDRIKISLIGHLQTNKVKYIIGIVDLIQSVDSLHLAEKIDSVCASKNTSVDILVQLNMGNEENKFGIMPCETEDFLRKVSMLSNIRVKGLMGVVPKTEDKALTKKYFLQLYNIFLDIKAKNIDNISMDILSMGMSGDYVEAIECGSNMVRVGSAIFGKRN